MFRPVQWNPWISPDALYHYRCQLFAFITNLALRIKEIAFSTFLKISFTLKAFDNQSSEINIKTIAMISCLSVIAVLVISMLPSRKIITPRVPKNIVQSSYQALPET